MRRYELSSFGLDQLRLVDAPPPAPGPGEVILEPRALSLNFRDLLIVRGQYNPRMALPATPLSDGAGVVTAIGTGVGDVRVGDRVVSHFVSGWQDGPFRGEYVSTTLGVPGPGLAAEQVALPAQAVLPIPAGYDFAQAATLPIAALTAWSALVTEGNAQAGQTVLTLGTGGVSIYALQLAKALGCRVIITSSSDEKLARAKALGADECVNYRARPDWEKVVLQLTAGAGVDIVVETCGAATLDKSLAATRPGGIVSLLGALAGMRCEISAGMILMRRLKICGVMVDSRAAFERMNAFLEQRRLQPVIDRRFPFDRLSEALEFMAAGEHLGKIVIDMP